MRELKSVEEKILDKALYLFGKHGSTNVPIRTISKEAKVNVSAINYYFGSKDQMLSNVQAFYIENIIAAYSALYDENLNDEEKVILCSNEIMEYSIRYPGVLVMQKEAANAEIKNEMDNKILDITTSMNHKLNETLDRVLKSSKENLKYDRMMFLASILHPISDLNIEGLNKDLLGKKDGRIKYIRYILDRLKS